MQKGEVVRVLQLRPSSCMSINPSRVGLVVWCNIVEMHGLGETFPVAEVLGTHSRGFVRTGEGRLKLIWVRSHSRLRRDTETPGPEVAPKPLRALSPVL